MEFCFLLFSCISNDAAFFSFSLSVLSAHGYLAAKIGPIVQWHLTWSALDCILMRLGKVSLIL